MKKRIRTDEPVETFLRNCPGFVSALLGKEPGRAGNPKFAHTQIKRVELYPDGVFTLQGDGEKTAHVIEFHDRADRHVFTKGLAEKWLLSYQNRDDGFEYRSLIVFTKKRHARRDAPEKHRYNRPDDECFRYVCLESFLEEHPDSPFSVFIQVLVSDNLDEILWRFPEKWDRLKKENRLTAAEIDEIELAIKSLVLSKFPTINKNNLGGFMSIGIMENLKKSVAVREVFEPLFREKHKEGMEKGTRKIIARLLEGKFGTLPKTIEEKLDRLKNGDLETVALKIIDAEKIEDVF